MEFVPGIVGVVGRCWVANGKYWKNGMFGIAGLAVDMLPVCWTLKLASQLISVVLGPSCPMDARSIMLWMWNFINCFIFSSYFFISNDIDLANSSSGSLLSFFTSDWQSLDSSSQISLNLLQTLSSNSETPLFFFSVLEGTAATFVAFCVDLLSEDTVETLITSMPDPCSCDSDGAGDDEM